VNPDLRNLIALQDLEQKISTFQKRISETPKMVQSLREELQSLKNAHQEKVTHSQELTKQRRTLEGGVDMMRTKLSKLKDQLMAVKTNKEYTAMLHEIHGAEEQIRHEEDKVLEIMEEMETLEGLLRSDQKDLDRKYTEIEANIRTLESSIPGFEIEAAKLTAEKSVVESQIGRELLSRYRRISEARKGTGLAEAKDELCSACHVRIRPQVYADLLRTENIHVCDSCSRILFAREVL
jgi:uncharacterized protein